jgi:hypothetical protein
LTRLTAVGLVACAAVGTVAISSETSAATGVTAKFATAGNRLAAYTIAFGQPIAYYSVQVKAKDPSLKRYVEGLTMTAYQASRKFTCQRPALSAFEVCAAPVDHTTGSPALVSAGTRLTGRIQFNRKLKKRRMLAVVNGYDARNTLLASKTVTIR